MKNKRITGINLGRSVVVILLAIPSLLWAQFSMEQVKSYPFPTNLTASATGSKIAWTFNQEGKQNVFVAQGPDFEARRLTSYMDDNGQAISSLSLSKDGRWVVFIRGGDFGSNWDDALPVNPAFDPDPPKVQIWSVPFQGGDPLLLGEGEDPVISPNSDKVVFVKSRQLWAAPIDGSSKAEKLFDARGNNNQPKWSPDGSIIAFRSNRGDHSFIGVYQGPESSILWIDPSFNRDHTPRWSPEGTKLTFIRQPGGGGAPEAILEPRHNPWKIMVGDLNTGKSQQVWKAPETLRGSLPTTHGRTNLSWAAGYIVFLSYHDGWPHLYSIPEDGGEEILLTPGNYMAEYISLSYDGKELVFAGNAGEDPLDIDRRHVVRVPVDGAVPEIMTPGTGLEWTPIITGDGEWLAYIGATSKDPPMPMVMDLKKRRVIQLAEEQIPKDYPSNLLVTPTQVVFKAPDGTPVHAIMFRANDGAVQKPGIIYVHGGPPRQMLLGWHYSSYYSNAYAVNQYLASQGYIVLSVNFRLGIGYGYEFHRPPDGGTRGASEYQDVKAGAEWLASQEFVDGEKIGIYGGSYGGYLTAMALGRDSQLFKAGVDIHGVHDRTINRTRNLIIPDKYEKAPDADKTLQTAWESSPVSNVDTWTSPVLIIHADDDRNVAFSQSTDLVQRLEKKGIDMETMVIVDDTHHFMMHANQMKVNKAVAEYFSRKLK